jgi:hypothetical protein
VPDHSVREAVPSSGSAEKSASIVKAPLQQPLQDHSGSKVVSQMYAVPSPVRRATDNSMHGQTPEPVRSASDRVDGSQQPLNVHFHDEGLRGVSRSGVTQQIVEHLQTLADYAPKSAPVVLMRAPDLHISASAEQSLSPAASQPVSSLPFAFHSSNPKTGAAASFPGPAHALYSPSSQRFAVTADEGSGSASSQPTAAAAAQVAARLNSALISFANFDK